VDRHHSLLSGRTRRSPPHVWRVCCRCHRISSTHVACPRSTMARAGRHMDRSRSRHNGCTRALGRRERPVALWIGNADAARRGAFASVAVADCASTHTDCSPFTGEGQARWQIETSSPRLTRLRASSSTFRVFYPSPDMRAARHRSVIRQRAARLLLMHLLHHAHHVHAHVHAHVHVLLHVSERLLCLIERCLVLRGIVRRLRFVDAGLPLHNLTQWTCRPPDSCNRQVPNGEPKASLEDDDLPSSAHSGIALKLEPS